ncbi:MAG: hypothetical protein IJS60_08830 [Abditibacteriota bacterium]|nr:hypothetical protein [Abditibacteriota bacterium]
MGGSSNSKAKQTASVPVGTENVAPQPQRVRTEQTTKMAQPEKRPVLTDKKAMQARRSELMTKLINKTANKADIDEYNDLSKRLGKSTNASLFTDYNE